MSSEKKRWRASPTLIVTLTALIVITGILVAGWLNARRYRVKARVEIGAPAVDIQPAQAAIVGNTINLPDGEVARTAARVRETSGLLLGLTMLAVTEQMSNRTVANADALIELMARRNLFPPGIRQTSVRGALFSDHATIYARYRSLPLGIEVVSIGGEHANGPTIIARLAVGGDDDSGALLLIAKGAEAAIPEPFAPLSQVIGSGWSTEPLRERSFAPEEIERLNEWARQYAATGR